MKNIFILASVLLFSVSVQAKNPVFATSDGAIRGYDPVAYFNEGKPVKGDSSITFDWEGATWRFASEENRQVFATSPETYAPAYGGYCAYAVANGYTATTDPHAWNIVNDRLYLNYSKGVQQRWAKDISGYISKADKNWPGVLTK